MSTKEMPVHYPEPVFCGSDHWLLLAMQAEERIQAGMFNCPEPKAETEEEVPWNFSMSGSIGVIAIRGPLTNRDSPYNKYYGVTSYPDIRRAMIYAAHNPEVTSILLDIHSGGGDVAGVADTGDLIAMVDRSIKPVYSYTEGTMASAAYWIGVSAREVWSSRTSLLGSIGVIATHMEYSKMFKEIGIGVNVVRAGKYKALLNSFEPASEKALEQLAGQLNAAYDVFIGHVADRLKLSVEEADNTVGQGREFFGADAVKAGLTKGLTSFDKLVSRISAKTLDKQGVTQNNGGKHQVIQMPRQALTETEIAALAAGAPEAQAAAGATTPTPEEIAAATAAAAAATEAAAATAAAAAKAEVTEPKEKKDDPAVLAFVQGQLREEQEKAVKAQVTIAGLEAKLTSVETTHKALVEIAAKSLTNMRVALKLAPVDASAMSAEALLAEHKNTSDAFAKSFKVGGVAAVNPPKEEPAAPVSDPLQKARVAATRL